MKFRRLTDVDEEATGFAKCVADTASGCIDKNVAQRRDDGWTYCVDRPATPGGHVSFGGDSENEPSPTLEQVFSR